MASPAVAFADDLSSRYCRMRTPAIRPVDAVLRALPAPARLDHRIFVDARSWRLVTAVAERATTARRRAEPASALAVMRIVERAARDDAPAANPQPLAWMPPVAERLRGRGDVDTRRPRGVPMVLARQSPPAESSTVKDTVSAGDGWPSSMSMPGHPARQAQKPSAPPPIDVNLLTDRVVAAIDRRLVATRERMGL